MPACVAIFLTINCRLVSSVIVGIQDFFFFPQLYAHDYQLEQILENQDSDFTWLIIIRITEHIPVLFFLQ